MSGERLRLAATASAARRLAWRAHVPVWTIVFALACSGAPADRPASDVPNGPDAFCPAGMIAGAPGCRMPCPEGWTTAPDDSCRPPCPDGWQSIEGTCAPPCPPGLEAVGVLCRPPDAAVGPRPCAADVWFDATGAVDGDVVVYVDAAGGRPDGDGSEGAPVDTLAAAFELVPDPVDGISLVLAPGEYGDVDLPALGRRAKAIRLLGACADRTTIRLAHSIDDPYLSVELRRLTVAGARVNVTRVALLRLEDARLERDDPDRTLLSLGPARGAVLVVERCEFRGGGFGIRERWVSHTILRGNRFADNSDGAVVLEDASSVDVFGNRFERDSAELATYSDLNITAANGADVWIRVEANYFAAGGYAPLTVKADAWLVDNSVAAPQAAGVLLLTRRDVRLSGLRVDLRESEGVADGVSAETLDGLAITGTLVLGAPGNGIELRGTRAVQIADTLVEGCEGSAIHASALGGAPGLDVAGATLLGNGRGLLAVDTRVRVAGSRIAGNAGPGLVFQQAPLVEVWASTVVGNGSTGIDLTALTGDATTVHEIADTLVRGNVGVGILVRSGGAGTVRLSGNRIDGTAPGQIANATVSYMLADGVVAVTGPNVTASFLELADENEISHNPRIGMLADGERTVVKDTGAPGADQVSGNGFGGFLAAPPESGTWDVVRQSDAEVIGLESVEPLVPVPGPADLGGGGDPRRPSDGGVE